MKNELHSLSTDIIPVSSLEIRSKGRKFCSKTFVNRKAHPKLGFPALFFRSLNYKANHYKIMAVYFIL